MSGGRSTYFGLPDNANGGRAGAADQSDLLKAIKLQAILKTVNAGAKNVNTRLHTESAVQRASYNPNQLAIQRSIFYRPI